MATDTVTPHQAASVSTIERAKSILGQIGQIAHRTDRLYHQTDGSISGDCEAMEHDRDHLRSVICQLGLLADIATQLLGANSISVRGTRAEEWILPSCDRPLAGG